MTANQRSGVVRQYAEAVFRRGRVDLDVDLDPEGPGAHPDDRPPAHKVYPAASRLPLAVTAEPLAPLDILVTEPVAEPPAGSPSIMDSVATVLRLSYGLLNRRVRVDWSQGLGRLTQKKAQWGRGAAAGGGLYPLEIYWVAGPDGPLLPGVYHYATAEHALRRLSTGDATAAVRTAAGHHPVMEGTDQFLVVSVQFQRNSFKYRNFCYHCVTHDVGVLLGTWEMLVRAGGHAMERVLWFDDLALDELFGFDPLVESVFALVPITWAGRPRTPVPTDARPTGPTRPVEEAAAPSRTALPLPRVAEVHLACFVGEQPRPDRGAADRAAARAHTGRPVMELPTPLTLDTPLDAALMARRSAFGNFALEPRLTAAELGTVLRFAAASRRYNSDVRSADAPLTRLFVLANRVDGLTSGVYGYDADRHVLVAAAAADRPPGGLGRLLQRAYFLQNYDMNRVGAVVAVTGRLDAVLDAFGDRGYRILNAEAGVVVQAVYVAATAAGIAAGAVFGLDNITMNEVLGLEGTDEVTQVFVLVGRPLAGIADLDLRLE